MKARHNAYTALLAACLLHASIASAAMSAKPVKAFVPAFTPPTTLFTHRYENYPTHQLSRLAEIPFLNLAVSQKPVEQLGVAADRQLIIAKTREVITATFNQRSSENLLASLLWKQRSTDLARTLIAHLERSGAVAFTTPQERDAVIAEMSLPQRDVSWHHFNQPSTFPFTVVRRLSGHAANAARARVYLETVERARLAHSLLVPEFFHDIRPIRIDEQDVSLESGGNAKAELLADGEGRIRFTNYFVTYQNERSKGPSLFAGDEIQHRIRMLVAGIHEYAHLLFNRSVGGQAGTPWGAGLTAYKTLDEGFAVMLELIAGERALSHRRQLGLLREDAQDIQSRMDARISSFERDKDPYTEGTLRFWRPLYEQSGTQGMVDFLHRLDPEKLLAFPLNGPKYHALLADPRRFEALTRPAP